MPEIDVNEYWMRRGATYIAEERLGRAYYRLQADFLLRVLTGSRVPLHQVLEIGCGYCRITKVLAEAYPAARFLALDLSSDQLANARRLCAGLSNISFQQYDLYSASPLPGGPYDVAIASEVLLHHPPSAVRMIVARLAERSDCIVNLDWSEEWPRERAPHVWVHDYAAIYKSLGLACESFELPWKIDGMQQKLFIAARDLRLDIEGGRSAAHAMRGLPLQEAIGTADDSRAWRVRLHAARDELAGLETDDVHPLVLVDDAQLGIDAIDGRRVIPFLEHGGQYWGAAADDAEAIAELERLRGEGASLIAFAWPAFWWLEYYSGLHAHLRSTSRCILRNSRLVVFDLRASATCD